MAFMALVLSATYSITAALGSAAGARANAATAEHAASDARRKAQATYDGARADLDALAGARPAAELQTLIEATKAELAKLPVGRSLAELETLDRRYAGRDCGAENGTGRWVCQRPGPYAGELARARHRERMEAKVAGLIRDATQADQRVE
jgi:hypothetical protein